MSTPLRITAFVVGLLVVLAAGLGIGAAVGPVADSDPAADQGHGHGGSAGESSGGEHGAHGAEAAVAGLEVSRAGHTLVLADPALDPGRRVLRFTVTGPDGEPVTDYDEQHEKDLHLIAVRRDLTGFQHVHPELGADGTWSVPLDLTPGAWRVFADLKPAGAEPLVLGADLLVGGPVQPAELGADRLADSVDGYDVTLGGSFVSGQETALSLTVTRGGEPVTDLEPYLGAFGHLVVLRAGDLGYLHAHPEDSGDGQDGSAGPAVTFHTTFPSAGRYRLFLDFQHGGTVRTAEFTVTVGDGHGHDHADAGSEHEHAESQPAQPQDGQREDRQPKDRQPRQGEQQHEHEEDGGHGH